MSESASEYKLKNLSELFTWLAETGLPQMRAEGRDVFICPAIRQANCPEPVRTKALKIIDDRLGNLTYIGWVNKHYPNTVRRDNYARAALEGRVQWCRALAEEFK